jgi:hypothetical protein
MLLRLVMPILVLESVGLSLQVDFHRSPLDVIQQQRLQQSLLPQLPQQNLQAPSLDHSDNNRPNQLRATLDHPSNRLDIHASKLQHR